MNPTKKQASLHSCNVLDSRAGSPTLWHFRVSNSRVELDTRQQLEATAALPPALVKKDWRSLWQRKLNVAWLPAHHVFLRVVHLPTSDLEEVVPMVELQLEKLSPLPVNQVVWSVELSPRHAEKMTTAIVVIAAREGVEQFLGELEQGGYLPDCLEVPGVHQLLSAPVEDRSIAVLPVVERERHACLVGWWFGGALHQLQLITIPHPEQAPALLVDQLNRTAWAGEMEGWLRGPFRCFLIAPAPAAPPWERALAEWSGGTVNTLSPMSDEALAEFAAGRAARFEGRLNLLPEDRRLRYHQQFVDRLWMSGLGAVLATYLVGVLIYFATLQVMQFRKSQVERRVAQLSTDYTNAMRLKARVAVLQNQLDLKYAALDCLRVASELLPLGVELDRFAFSKGQKLGLRGTAAQESDSQLTDFNAALRKATLQGEPLFTRVEPPMIEQRGGSVLWSFQCDLKSEEAD